jgi:hypothetical protein
MYPSYSSIRLIPPPVLYLHPSIHASVFLSIYLSICLSIYLSSMYVRSTYARLYIDRSAGLRR